MSTSTDDVASLTHHRPSALDNVSPTVTESASLVRSVRHRYGVLVRRTGPAARRTASNRRASRGTGRKSP